MTSFNEEIEKLASDIRAQHEDLTVDTFLLLDSTYDVIHRYVDMHFSNHTLSQTGFKVLNALILYGGHMIPTDISKKIFRSKHSVSKVIFTLESHGLVKIGSVGEDRRKREVKITAKGLAVAKKGNIYVRQRMSEEVMGILDKKEIGLMRKMLKKLRTHTSTLVGKKSKQTKRSSSRRSQV